MHYTCNPFHASFAQSLQKSGARSRTYHPGFFFLHAPISLSEKRKKTVGPNVSQANQVSENCIIPTCSLGGKLEGPSEVVVPVGVLAGDPGHVYSGVPQPGEGVPAPVNIPVEVHRVKLLLLPLGRVLAAELHPGKYKKKHIPIFSASKFEGNQCFGDNSTTKGRKLYSISLNLNRVRITFLLQIILCHFMCPIFVFPSASLFFCIICHPPPRPPTNEDPACV